MAKLSLFSKQTRALKQNSLTPEMQGRGGFPYHRNHHGLLLCCLLFLSISPSAMTRLSCKLYQCMKALSTDWSWGLTLPSSYTGGEEWSCFFILSPSVAESYFWAYTPTHPRSLHSCPALTLFLGRKSETTACSSEKNKRNFVLKMY